MSVNVEQIREYYLQVKEYLDRLIIGEDKAKDVIVSSLLCDKNTRLLLMGLPGTGKSTISNGLAKNFESKKIFVTSDLLPNDILSVVRSEKNLQLLQLEELNRASGKTQSVFIDLLPERTAITNNQESPYSYTIATQNDSEIAGIFDVPYAIYDRFDVNINFGNLTLEELEKVIFEFTAREEKANFDLKNIIDITSKAVEEFVYSTEDRRVFMEAVQIINTCTYSGKRLFATSNTRGHLFAKKIALFHAFINGRKCIMPNDFSDYISNIYLHRINQTLLKMNDEQTNKVMKDIENKVLSIERKKIKK